MANFGVVVGAKVLYAIASCLLGPALAAVSLGLVGYALLSARLGRNARFLSLGNAIAAGVLPAGSLSAIAGWPISTIVTALPRFCGPLNPAQKESAIEVKTRTDDEQTYVLCRSEQRIAKDRAIRAKYEERLRADIDKLTKRLADGRLVNVERINIGRLKERYPRVARYFDLTYDQHYGTLNAEFDADKHVHAERLDGCYLLKTNRKDLSGDELWRIYILLTRAETAFRDMKSPLAERPIWHHLEQRVDVHIFLCVFGTWPELRGNWARLSSRLSFLIELPRPSKS